MCLHPWQHPAKHGRENGGVSAWVPVDRRLACYLSFCSRPFHATPGRRRSRRAWACWHLPQTVTLSLRDRVTVPVRSVPRESPGPPVPRCGGHPSSMMAERTPCASTAAATQSSQRSASPQTARKRWSSESCPARPARNFGVTHWTMVRLLQLRSTVRVMSSSEVAPARLQTSSLQSCPGPQAPSCGAQGSWTVARPRSLSTLPAT